MRVAFLVVLFCLPFFGAFSRILERIHVWSGGWGVFWLAKCSSCVFSSEMLGVVGGDLFLRDSIGSFLVFLEVLLF